ncbi:hypothetical protein DOTSEDRAFT_22467 [Dothistroma septosporum NZE10]|uniref:Myb-like domain-containing protein n=1 Tax=Dothistroma septosporum (strain NZE10 / CBS 128990) TaxID=675120 RepID=N1PTW3_DOTSN|nr:hypothetical protein DOTSEDRAFT_22467 [Dothistroma septosporum NZE10]
MDDDSPLAAKVSAPCSSDRFRRDRADNPRAEDAGASLEAKVAAGRPIAYVVLNRRKELAGRIEKGDRPTGRHAFISLQATRRPLISKHSTTARRPNHEIRTASLEVALTPRSSGKQKVFSENELTLLKRLKDKDRLSWEQIRAHFPGRSLFSLAWTYDGQTLCE